VNICWNKIEVFILLKRFECNFHYTTILKKNLHLTFILFMKGIVINGIGIIVGLIAGYLYYQQIGCISGTCAITSKPLNSTLYGGLLGGLLFNLFVTSPKKKENNEKE